MIYIIAPLSAWFVAGILKFIFNRFSDSRTAIKQIGLGGFPSNHATIVSTTASVVGFTQGWGTPIFGVALTVAFIVIIDAMDLRRKVGVQAQAINRHVIKNENEKLRERMGHNPAEVLGGVVIGVFWAYLLTFMHTMFLLGQL